MSETPIQVEIVRPKWTSEEWGAKISGAILNIAILTLVVFWFFASWFPGLGLTLTGSLSCRCSPSASSLAARSSDAN